MFKRNSLNCWICGEDATSGEHKIKRSLLKKIYDQDFKDKQVLHYKNGKLSKLNGPNSKKAKFEEVICCKCNNDDTQNFDFAYDKFSNYIINNYNLINNTRMIDFSKIYGKDFPIEQTNLFKYFAKIFGCDLCENHFPVPIDVVDLLNKDFFSTRLKISFSINENFINSENPTKVVYGTGWLTTSQANIISKKEINPFYTFEIVLSYLSVNIFYNAFTDVGLGSEWIADKQYVYVGSSPLKKIFD